MDQNHNTFENTDFNKSMNAINVSKGDAGFN